MTFKETMAALFVTAEGTYYKWKNENRPIILLLDKYFTKQDLEEFLNTGQIKKMELIESSQELISYVGDIQDRMLENEVDRDLSVYGFFIGHEFVELINNFYVQLDSTVRMKFRIHFVNFLVNYEINEILTRALDETNLNNLKIQIVRIVHKISEDEFDLFIKNVKFLDLNYTKVTLM
jgi:hypothetical protein